MGHAVYHRTASGEAQLEDVSSLEAALELVERLRNEEGPTDVRLFKEVSVEVRTYYRVVAAEDGDSSPTPEPEATTQTLVDEDPADEAVVADADDVPAAESDAAAVDETVADVADEAVTHDEVPPAPSPIIARAEPPAGAMPLLSPPPAVTVHASEDDAAEPAAASAGGEHRPKLFNRS